MTRQPTHRRDVPALTVSAVFTRRAADKHRTPTHKGADVGR